MIYFLFRGVTSINVWWFTDSFLQLGFPVPQSRCKGQGGRRQGGCRSSAGPRGEGALCFNVPRPPRRPASAAPVGQWSARLGAGPSYPSGLSGLRPSNSHAWSLRSPQPACGCVVRLHLGCPLLACCPSLGIPLICRRRAVCVFALLPVGFVRKGQQRDRGSRAGDLIQVGSGVGVVLPFCFFPEKERNRHRSSGSSNAGRATQWVHPRFFEKKNHFVN